jgi:serine phosphatase RsbU (regulator of sigma subunit)
MVAIRDARAGRFEVWCGGMPPPVVLDRAGRLLHEFTSMHLALGVLDVQEFDARTESFQFDGPGQLIKCSDGATEAESADGKQFGRARLLRTPSAAPPDERLARLRAAIGVGVIQVVQ